MRAGRKVVDVGGVFDRDILSVSSARVSTGLGGADDEGFPGRFCERRLADACVVPFGVWSVSTSDNSEGSSESSDVGDMTARVGLVMGDLELLEVLRGSGVMHRRLFCFSGGNKAGIQSCAYGSIAFSPDDVPVSSSDLPSDVTRSTPLLLKGGASRSPVPGLKPCTLLFSEVLFPYSFDD